MSEPGETLSCRSSGGARGPASPRGVRGGEAVPLAGECEAASWTPRT